MHLVVTPSATPVPHPSLSSPRPLPVQQGQRGWMATPHPNSSTHSCFIALLGPPPKVQSNSSRPATLRSSGLHRPLCLSVDLVCRFFSLSRFHLLLSLFSAVHKQSQFGQGVTDPVCILLTCLYQSPSISLLSGTECSSPRLENSCFSREP